MSPFPIFNKNLCDVMFSFLILSMTHFEMMLSLIPNGTAIEYHSIATVLLYQIGSHSRRMFLFSLASAVYVTKVSQWILLFP